MPHWPKPLGFRPADFSLDRICELLKRLGNPEKKLPPIIHVAGTNGKGSTIAFMRSILQYSGLGVHTYTSPHLVNFNERIVLNGQAISNSYLHEILEECREASEGIPITFFEGTTVAALLAFSKVKSDIILLEVGMGGRLDATNVVDPIITVITSISLDHMTFLGPTVEVIAGEKCGIIKNNVTCVSAPQQQSVMKVIEHFANINHAELYRGDIDWLCKRQGQKMFFIFGSEVRVFPLPILLGDHQIINAGNAIFTCEVLKHRFGYNISRDDIEKGITNANWPARIERIDKGKIAQMLPKNWQLFLDGAHNAAGAEALSQWIKNELSEKVYVILGMTRDRNSASFVQYLQPYIKGLYSVCVKSEPRSQTAEEIAQATFSIGVNCVPCYSIESAIEKILSSNNCENRNTILVCGSLFLAGDILSLQ